MTRRSLPNRLRRAFDVLVGRPDDTSARRWRWGAELPSAQAAILAERPIAGRRARWLAANNALAASAVEAWVSALVGTGIKPQSAHPDEAIRTTLNTGFEAWTDRADADGLTDFYGLQALAARRLVTDGEGFVAMTSQSDGSLSLRVLDADQVDAALTREMDGFARIVQGVEFDAAGRRVAYHMLRDRPGLPIAAMLDTVRVSAEDVVHLFNPIVAGQVRGLTWFAPVLRRLADLDETHEAQLVRQKVGALFAGFVTTAEENGDERTLFGGQGAPDGDGVALAALEPGTMQMLRPGEDIRFSTPAAIGPESITFLQVTAREIAAGLGLPEATLTGDLSQVNYSSIRAGLVEFRRRVEALQHNVLVFQFCRPVWRRYVTTAILSGAIDAPGFEADPEAYLAARWITPRNDWVDPAKDVGAEVAAIEAGLVSRRQAVAARGYDLETLDAEIAADNARAERLGLAFGAKPQPQPVPVEEAAA